MGSEAAVGPQTRALPQKKCAVPGGCSPFGDTYEHREHAEHGEDNEHREHHAAGHRPH